EAQRIIDALARLQIRQLAIFGKLLAACPAMRDRLDAQHMRRRLLVAPHLQPGERVGPEPYLQRRGADRGDRAERDLRPVRIPARRQYAEDATGLLAEIPWQTAVFQHLTA